MADERSNSQDARQIAYVVPDVRAAAERHSEIFGSGPYYVAKGLTFEGHLYRGRPTSVDVDIALGQWGDLQMEFIQLNDDRPSVFGEVTSRDASFARIHHICIQPHSLEDTVRRFGVDGCQVAFDFTTSQGTRVVMIDTLSRLGHFVEAYERTDEISDLYDRIRQAGETFDGRERVRPMSRLRANG